MTKIKHYFRNHDVNKDLRSKVKNRGHKPTPRPRSRTWVSRL